MSKQITWKYRRDKINRVSKWTHAPSYSWVTKWDDDRFCVIGLNGQVTDWKADNAKAARNAIECAHQTNSDN